MKKELTDKQKEYLKRAFSNVIDWGALEAEEVVQILNLLIEGYKRQKREMDPMGFMGEMTDEE